MMTDSFLWLRHYVECRKRPRCSFNAPGCKVGKVLFALMLREQKQRIA